MSTIAQMVEHQLRRWEIERRASQQPSSDEPIAPSHLHLELHRPSPVTRPMVTVTISRMRGCRGPGIAACLAERLGYQVFDKEVVNYIATHRKVHERVLALLDERTASAITLWAEGFVAGRHVDRRDYVRFLSGTVRAIHAHGGAVILGRGAGCILEGQTALRVMLTAPLESRVQQVMLEEHLSEGAALATVRQDDRQRERFVAESFASSWRDASYYDLTINVHGLADNVVAELIESFLCRFAAERWPKAVVGNPAVGSSADLGGWSMGCAAR